MCHPSVEACRLDVDAMITNAGNHRTLGSTVEKRPTYLCMCSTVPFNAGVFSLKLKKGDLFIGLINYTTKNTEIKDFAWYILQTIRLLRDVRDSGIRGLTGRFSPRCFSPPWFSLEFSVRAFQSQYFQSRIFQSRLFQSKTFQSKNFSVQNFSVPTFSVWDFSVRELFSPGFFSPNFFSPRLFSPDDLNFFSSN